ncbi:MAG: PASTA domain-containing protein [Candidatus Binataceae bacterium]
MGADDKQGSWWQTLPGVVTALGSLLAAITGLIVAWENLKAGTPPPAPQTVASTVLATPVAPMKTATIPSVIGVSAGGAKLVLKSLGFTNIHEVRKFSTAKRGTVIEQVPSPGTNLPLDQLVSLFVPADEAKDQAKPPVAREEALTSPVEQAQPGLNPRDLRGKWIVRNEAFDSTALVFAEDHRVLWYKATTVVPIGMWHLDNGQMRMKLNADSPFPKAMRVSSAGPNGLVAKGDDGTVYDIARLR